MKAIDGTGSGKHIGNSRLLDICQQIVKNTDQITSDNQLQEYANLLIAHRAFDLSNVEIPSDEDRTETIPEPETTEPEQDTAALFEQAKTLIMKLSTGGYRNEAVAILNQFGANKLGQVPQEKLAEVVRLAEKALEG